MRYSPAEKREIIHLVEHSNLSIRKTLEELDLPRSTFYDRYRKYQEEGFDGLVENLVRAIVELQDGSLWFGTYPYARDHGGFSIAKYEGTKSLPDRVLKLLPDRPGPKE